MNSNRIQFKIFHMYDKENFFIATMSLNKTFDDLMKLILDELEWDFDHLYTVYCSYTVTLR